jgi:uncharacterized membrane protein
MNYVDVSTRSFQLFRRHKSFWLMGMLMALCGQSEYSFSTNYNQSGASSPSLGSGPSSPTPALPDFLNSDSITTLMANIVPIIAGIVAFSMIGWVIFAILGWFVHGALIQMIAAADQEQVPSWRAGFRRSRQQIGHLFVMQLLIALPGFVLLIIMLLLFVPTFITLFKGIASTSAGEPFGDPFRILAPLLGGLICLLPLFLILALVQIVYSMIQRLAARYCVLEELGARESLRQGWRLFRKNVGYSVLTWGLSAVFSFLFALIAALPVFLLLLPAARGMFADGWSSVTIGALAGLAIYGVLLGIGVGGICTSFNVTVWSLLFRRFRDLGEQPLSVGVGDPV